jgi:putative tricarboxylic transport membrane protein
VIGAIPGAGAVIASFIGYSEARRNSRHPELFGNGALEGVAAAEAANNAVTASAMIPMLTLGVPGSVVAAIVLGALMMNGLVPGPSLFRDHAAMTYTVMVGMIFINIFMFLQGKLLLRAFVAVTRILPALLMVLVLVMCLTGTFAVNNTLLDIIVLLVFALLGYILIKLEFPLPPVVLGLVLGPMSENTLRQSLLLSDGTFSIFWTRPISILFLVITVLSVVMAIHRQLSPKKKIALPDRSDDE